MRKEHDIVYLKTNCGVLKKGTKGVIVSCYPNDTYEVEFFDKENNTLCVKSFYKNFLSKEEV